MAVCLLFALDADRAVLAVGPYGSVQRFDGGKRLALDCDTFAELEAALARHASDGWFFGERGAADAILDRLVHRSHRLVLKDPSKIYLDLTDVRPAEAERGKALLTKRVG